MKARLYRPARSAMSSGMAQSRAWVLEWEATAAPQTDPLMGWSGNGDTNTQLKLQFESQAEALHYADAHGIDVTIIPSQERQPNLRAFGYGENFMTNRRVPWSH